MGGVDTGVDHVRAGALTSAAVVDVGGGARGLVREAADTPRGTALRDVGVDAEDSIFLNVFDLLELWLVTRIAVFLGSTTYLGEKTDLVQEGSLELASEAPELLAAVDVVRLGLAELANGSLEGVVAGTLPQLDEVLVRDDLAHPGGDDRGALLDGLSGGGRKSSGQKSQEGDGEMHLDEI